MRNNNIYGNKYMDFLGEESRDFLLWRLLRTPEQEKYWNNYISEHPDEMESLERAAAIADSLMLGEEHNTDTSALFERIKLSVLPRQRHRVFKLAVSFAVAAAVTILLIVPSIIIRQRSNTIRDERLPSSILAQQFPESNNIVLHAGTRYYELRDSTHIRLNNGHIMCDGQDLFATPPLSTCILKLKVPPGKHSFISLDDSSKVWVNSATELEFPLSFSSECRHIAVNGEIFLNVTHDSSRPFMVKTREMDVVVKGTSFNVSAYEQDNETSVVLVSGKVQIHTRDNQIMDIAPRQRVVLEADRLRKGEVDVSKYTSWKDGYLSFDNTPVPEMLLILSKYYGLRFNTKSQAFCGKTLTGKLQLSSDIDEILTSLSLLTSSQWNRQGDSVIFSISPHN